MDYDMTTPCGDCPFRREGFIQLTAGRCHEIVEHEGGFPCHRTLDYSADDGRKTPQTKVCAGFLILREQSLGPNQMMRIVERCGGYDAKKLLENNPAVAEVFGSLDEMVEAHVARRSRQRQRKA